MDLNASPLPEEDEDPFKRRREDHIESAVEIARRVGAPPIELILIDRKMILWMICNVFNSIVVS